MQTYIDIFKNFDKIIWAAVIISAICIFLLAITKELINPRLKKYFNVPVPMELLVIIFGTLASYYGSLNENYKLPVVGHIPNGIPSPKIPPLSIMSKLIADSFAIGIVAYSSAISLAKLFAKKHNYEVDPNQELIAFGIGNIISSFFNCFVFTASLSRSLVQEGAGGNTQVAGLVSCTLILVVLMALGKLFQCLPTCVLAAIIIVNLKGMFMQLADLKDLWRVSKHDFATWLVVFLATVIVDVDIGLAIGIGFALLTIIQRAQNPYTSTLGHIENTDIYKDITISKNSKEIPSIKILRFESSLYFTNKDYFLEKVYHRTNIYPATWQLKITKLDNEIKRLSECFKNKKKNNENSIENVEKLKNYTDKLHKMKNQPLKTIVLDCCLMAYADTVGISTLDQIITDYKKLGISFLLANCNSSIVEVLVAGTECFFKKEYLDNIYVTVHDAVLASQVKKNDTCNICVINGGGGGEENNDDGDNDDDDHHHHEQQLSSGNGNYKLNLNDMESNRLKGFDNQAIVIDEVSVNCTPENNV